MTENSLPPERTPVIVGVGEFSDRIGADHAGFEPRDLIARALAFSQASSCAARPQRNAFDG